MAFTRVESSIRDRTRSTGDGSSSLPIDGTPKVLIIEDHALIAQSLSLSLRLAGFAVRLILLPTMRGLEGMLRWEPSIALLDLDLGPAGRGSAFIEPMRRAGCHVIVLTAITDVVDLCECYEAGASAVLDKGRPIDTLITAMRTVLAGGDPDAPGRAELLADRRRQASARSEWLRSFEGLTQREQEILAALTEGRSASDIAAASGVSLWTVRAQIKSVLQKLGVNSQLAAVAMVRRCDWRATTEP